MTIQKEITPMHHLMNLQNDILLLLLQLPQITNTPSAHLSET